MLKKIAKSARKSTQKSTRKSAHKSTQKLIRKPIYKSVYKPIHQSHFIVAFCLGIITGSIVALIFRINFFSSPLWLIASIIIMILTYLSPRPFLIPLAFVAGLFPAFYRSSEELAGEDYIRQFYNQNIVVSGTVDGDPENDDGKIKFKLKYLNFGPITQNDNKAEASSSESANQATGSTSTTYSANQAASSTSPTNQATSSTSPTYSAKGNLYVSLSGSSSPTDLARGDQITLSGKLSEGFGTYSGFLSRPNIVKWQRPSPGDFAVNIRNWFAARVQKLIPEPQQNLGLSYLLGLKTGLPDSLDQGLRTVGLVHIVVASGAHLSILVDLARKIFGKLSRMVSVIFSLISIIFFMAMVGWTPSIMRAGLMSGLKTVAWRVGHTFAPWRIILLAMAITLLINPMFLINLGWLLSFASFTGIMILGPALAKFFFGERKPKFIASTVLTTLSATLMTLPITLYYFGTLSLISVLPNLLILPTLPYAMGLVFLTGVVQGIPGIETAVSFMATKLLDFHIAVVDFFGQMKSFLVEIETNQTWVFALYLFLVPLIIIFIVKIFRKIHRRHNERVII